MSNVPAKVIIKIESQAEQLDHVKNSRKTLKTIQKASADKENLIGRTMVSKSAFLKYKADNDSEIKRKKLQNQATQTDKNLFKQDKENDKRITVEDLTTDEDPGEHYWKLLAEKRRLALEESLVENEKLHERIEGLENELDTSNKMLTEAQHLVEVLTEMMTENEEQTENAQDVLPSTSGYISMEKEELLTTEDTDDE